MVRNRFILLVLLSGITTLSAQVSNVDFATQVYPIFSSAGCLPSCHGSNGGLTIGSSAATAYINLVGPLSGCNSMAYITPGNSSTSYLYLKVTGNAACGGRMPASDPTYFDSNAGELELLRVWIEEGALEQATVIAVDESRDRLPAGFSLSQNYPNPFNPTTEIAYELSTPASVTLTIFDLLGQVVYRYEPSVMDAGRHTNTWRATDYTGAAVPSGIYVYRLVARPIDGSAPLTESRKMVLLK